MRLGLGFQRPVGGGGLYSPGVAATPMATIGWSGRPGINDCHAAPRPAHRAAPRPAH
jgi:hypothetical protein